MIFDPLRGYNVEYNIARIEINFAMPNPNKDYIAVGEFYDSPGFQSLRLMFKSYSEIDGAKIYVGYISA